MIKLAQISPFDFCNNQCWYCPVRYYPQPDSQHMPPELFEKIIRELVQNKGTVVSPAFDFLYTSHYNEVLLYRYLPEMLETLRKYQIKTMILTNGVAFTRDKIDLINAYRDVVCGINFNIPAFDEDNWCKDTGHKSGFDSLIKNVDAVSRAFSDMGRGLSIGVNSMNASEANRRVGEGKYLFPGLNIYPAVGLCDRAGLLVGYGISNEAEIARNRAGRARIAGCRNGERLTDWIHVNASGKVFACCDDYFFKHEFGDFNTQRLIDIYPYDLGNTVDELCAKCSFARWE